MEGMWLIGNKLLGQSRPEVEAAPDPDTVRVGQRVDSAGRNEIGNLDATLDAIELWPPDQYLQAGAREAEEIVPGFAERQPAGLHDDVLGRCRLGAWHVIGAQFGFVAVGLARRDLIVPAHRAPRHELTWVHDQR